MLTKFTTARRQNQQTVLTTARYTTAENSWAERSTTQTHTPEVKSLKRPPAGEQGTGPCRGLALQHSRVTAHSDRTHAPRDCPTRSRRGQLQRQKAAQRLSGPGLEGTFWSDRNVPRVDCRGDYVPAKTPFLNS